MGSMYLRLCSKQLITIKYHCKCYGLHLLLVVDWAIPFETHTPLLVKCVNWGYLYTPIQTGTFECGYTPAYWGYTKYECDYTSITWEYPNAPSIGDMLLNAFIWHFRFHAGNAQMGTSPVGSVSTFPLAESDVCPRFTPFTNAVTHTHPPCGSKDRRCRNSG